jgi:rubrerythrin
MLKNVKEAKMSEFKCTNCGYTFSAQAPPKECPSCKAKCEFVDITCYIPDCQDKGKDDRLG